MVSARRRGFARLSPLRVLVLLLAAALVGLGIFGTLVYRAVSVEQASPSEALRRFTAVRSLFANQVPMLELDDQGRVTASPQAPTPAPDGIQRLKVLAYHAADERLVTADVPYWFFRMKRPAVQFVVRDTGLDLDQLRLTPENLKYHGPGLILDHTRPNGDRLLVWAE